MKFTNKMLENLNTIDIVPKFMGANSNNTFKWNIYMHLQTMYLRRHLLPILDWRNYYVNMTTFPSAPIT